MTWARRLVLALGVLLCLIALVVFLSLAARSSGDSGEGDRLRSTPTTDR